jgi:hypothetical protein
MPWFARKIPCGEVYTGYSAGFKIWFLAALCQTNLHQPPFGRVQTPYAQGEWNDLRMLRRTPDSSRLYMVADDAVPYIGSTKCIAHEAAKPCCCRKPMGLRSP